MNRVRLLRRHLPNPAASSEREAWVSAAIALLALYYPASTDRMTLASIIVSSFTPALTARLVFTPTNQWCRPCSSSQCRWRLRARPGQEAVPACQDGEERDAKYGACRQGAHGSRCTFAPLVHCLAKTDVCIATIVPLGRGYRRRCL